MEKQPNLVVKNIVDYLDLKSIHNLSQASKLLRKKYRDNKSVYPKGVKNYFNERMTIYRVSFAVENTIYKTYIQYLTSNVKKMAVNDGELSVLSSNGTLRKYSFNKHLYIGKNEFIEYIVPTREDFTYKDIIDINNDFIYYDNKVTMYDNEEVNYKYELPKIGFRSKYYENIDSIEIPNDKFIMPDGTLYVNKIAIYTNVKQVIGEFILFNSGELRTKSTIYFKSGIISIHTYRRCIYALHQNGKLYIYGLIDTISVALNFNTIRDFVNEYPDLYGEYLPNMNHNAINIIMNEAGITEYSMDKVQKISSALFLQNLTVIGILDFLEIKLPLHIVDVIFNEALYILTL